MIQSLSSPPSISQPQEQSENLVQSQHDQQKNLQSQYQHHNHNHNHSYSYNDPSFNPFNQSHNIFYRYTVEDIKIIVAEVIKQSATIKQGLLMQNINMSKNGNMNKFIGVFVDKISIQFLKYVKIVQNTNDHIYGIFIQSNNNNNKSSSNSSNKRPLQLSQQYCVFYIYYDKQQDRICCRYKNSTGNRMIPFENQWKLINKDKNNYNDAEIKVIVKQIQPKIKDQWTKSTRAIFTIKNLQAMLNSHSNNTSSSHTNNIKIQYYRPKNIQQTLKTRLQLSKTYLFHFLNINTNYNFNNNKQFQNLPYQQKLNKLIKLQPLTQLQFIQMTGIDAYRIGIQMQELMVQGIKRGDYQGVKSVLKCGVVDVNAGFKVKGERVSFLALVSNVMENSQKNAAIQQTLTNIKKQLILYGCSSTVKQVENQNEKLKTEQTQQILKQLSKQNRVDMQLYRDFMDLLRSYMTNIIIGLKAASSGEVQSTSGTALDGILSKLLSKTPYIGQILSNAYDSFVAACQAARKQHLSLFFSGFKKIQAIVDDFGIRVIRHYGQEIINPIPFSIFQKIQNKINEVVQKISISFPKEFKYKIKGQTKNLAVEWQVLIRKYTSLFINFLMSQTASKNFNNPGLGILAAKQLFQYHKLSKQELKQCPAKLQFAIKIVSFINQISVYPNSFTVDGCETYWCDTNLQKSVKFKINTKCYIRYNQKGLFIVLNANFQLKKFLNTKYKKIKHFQISSQLWNQFQVFLREAQFYNTFDYGDDKNRGKKKSFGKIIEQYIKKYRDHEVSLFGNQNGGVLCSLLYLYLDEIYKIPSDKIAGLSFGMKSWMIKKNIKLANKYFQDHQMVLILENSFKRQKMHFPPGTFLFLNPLLPKQQQQKLLLQKQHTLKQYLKYSTQYDLSYASQGTYPQQQQNQQSKDNISGYTMQNYAKNGDLQTIKYLIQECGVDPNICTYKKQNLLSQVLKNLAYIRKKNQDNSKIIQIIKYLVQKGANINQRAQASWTHYQTPLHYAAYYGDLDLFKYLIKKGGDPHIKDNKILWYGNTPLKYAASSNNLQLVKYLVQQFNLDVNEQDSYGETPLQQSIGNFQMTKYLIQKGANVNAGSIYGRFVFVPLCYAARAADVDLVKYLIQKGADVNIKGPSDVTPLYQAAHYRCISVFKYLVEKGANIYYQNKDKMNCLEVLVGKNLGLKSPNRDWKFIFHEGDQNRTEDDNDLIIFIQILKLQGRLQQKINFQSYQSTFEKLLARKSSYFSISSEFVSEFIQIKDKFQQKLSDKSISQIQKSQIKTQKQQFIEFQRQFFEGDHKIQIFNRAIRNFYTFWSPTRLTETLQICDNYLSIHQQDIDFLFLKGLIYLYQTSDMNKQRSKYFKQKIQNILSELQLLPPSSTYWYLKGQFLQLDNKATEAQQCYRKSIEQDKYFLHPKIKLLSLILDKPQDSYSLEEQKYIGQLIHTVNSANKSLDADLMVSNLNQILGLKQHIFQKPQKSQQVNFDFALLEIFSINPQIYKKNLSKSMPATLLKKKLTYINNNNKNVQFQIGNCLNKIDYAYNLLKKLTGTLFQNKESVPEKESNTFFDKITELVLQLKSFLSFLVDQCDDRFWFNNNNNNNNDSNNVNNKQNCINWLKDLIKYYKNYIIKVIHDYNNKKQLNYNKKFYSGRGTQLDINQQISIFTQRTLNFYDYDHKQTRILSGPYSINKQISQTFTIKQPKTDQIYGTHKVIVLPKQGQTKIFYKYQPYAPGIQYAVGSLYKLILPNSTPETMIMKLTDGKTSGLYLASKAIKGQNFSQVINQIQTIKTIDMRNYSGLFLSSFLVCTGDAKPDNFILHFNYDTRGLVSTELVSIDNDIAFYRAKLKIGNTGNQEHPKQKKLYSEMLNILYLMPQMDQPISPYVKSFLNKPQNQPEIIVAKWLNNLYKKNENYLNMKGFTKQDLQKLKLPIKLPIGTASMVYSLLTKIQNLLKQQSITHTQIFHKLSPSLSYFYSKYRDNSSMINSLKNLYVAAGADPSILASLYSSTNAISTKAWNTMSASKRKNVFQFRKLFCSQIVDQAQGFLSSINFKGKNQLVLDAIKQNLYFVNNLILTNISQSQLSYLQRDDTFKNIKKIQVIQKKSQIIQKPKQNPKINPILKIDSIWHILQLQNIPNSDELIQTIYKNMLNINSQDKNGDTVLHQVVRLSWNKNHDQKRISKLIKILLDCGIDISIKNINKKTALDLTEKVPHIALTILDFQNTYFQKLIKQNRLAEAEIIAQASCSGSCLQMIDSEIVGFQTSMLRDAMSDTKLKKIAILILKKLNPQQKLFDHELLSLFAEHYNNQDKDLLDLLLMPERGLSPAHKNAYGKYPADIALKRQNYLILNTLLNKGGILSEAKNNANLMLACIASKYGIQLDENDLRQKYDCYKVDLNGNTVFHLMALAKDRNILNYKDLVLKLRETKNNLPQPKSLQQLSVDLDFVDLLELLYQSSTKQQYSEAVEKYIKDNKIRKQLKLLQKYDFTISLTQARLGINYWQKCDKFGNTALQVIALKYIQQQDEEIFDEMLQLLSYCNPEYINHTLRPDQNTCFHLLIRANQLKLCLKLYKNIEKNDIDLNVKNCQGQTVVDFDHKFTEGKVFGVKVMTVKQKQKGKQKEKEQKNNYQAVQEIMDEIIKRKFDDLKSLQKEIQENQKKYGKLTCVQKIMNECQIKYHQNQSISKKTTTFPLN